MAVKNTKAANRKYLQGLFNSFKDAPRAIAIEAASMTFLKCVFDTPADSGQAMANWRMEPYVGTPNLEAFEMMWGYGQEKPTEPVGYKWSKGTNTEDVKLFQYEVAVQSRVAFSRLKFDGVVVYNPLSSQIPGFSPSDGEFYEANSIGKVQVSDIISDSLLAAYDWGIKTYPALRMA